MILLNAVEGFWWSNLLFNLLCLILGTWGCESGILFLKQYILILPAISNALLKVISFFASSLSDFFDDSFSLSGSMVLLSPTSVKKDPDFPRNVINASLERFQTIRCPT